MMRFVLQDALRIDDYLAILHAVSKNVNGAVFSLVSILRRLVSDSGAKQIMTDGRYRKIIIIFPFIPKVGYRDKVFHNLNFRLRGKLRRSSINSTSKRGHKFLSIKIMPPQNRWLGRV